jgi:hypothetical protein
VKEGRGRLAVARRSQREGRDASGWGGGGGRLAIWGGSSLIQAVDILRNASALKLTEEALLWRASLLGDGPSVFFFFFPL